MKNKEEMRLKVSLLSRKVGLITCSLVEYSVARTRGMKTTEMSEVIMMRLYIGDHSVGNALVDERKLGS